MEIIWFAFVIGWISLMLKSSSNKRKGYVPRMRNPPPPPKMECICNRIENHSPGGRCEACIKDAEEAELRYNSRKNNRNEIASFLAMTKK